MNKHFGKQQNQASRDTAQHDGDLQIRIKIDDVPVGSKLQTLKLGSTDPQTALEEFGALNRVEN